MYNSLKLIRLQYLKSESDIRIIKGLRTDVILSISASCSVSYGETKNHGQIINEIKIRN